MQFPDQQQFGAAPAHMSLVVVAILLVKKMQNASIILLEVPCNGE